MKSRMTDKSLTPMELDALGEVMNISLGSSATAVSNILGHRVEITTPAVTVVTNSEFPMDDLLHVIGVEVHYVSGLAGNNLLILKRKDAQMIVDTLMGNEFSNGEFEKDELSVSALCEVMISAQRAFQSAAEVSKMYDELMTKAATNLGNV